MPGPAGKNELKKCWVAATVLNQPGAVGNTHTQTGMQCMSTRSLKRLYQVIIAAFVIMAGCIFPARSAFAREEPGTEGEGESAETSKPRVFGFDAGIQGSYATGVSTNSFFCQRFSSIGTSFWNHGVSFSVMYTY
jgi:hypothetical protein